MTERKNLSEDEKKKIIIKSIKPIWVEGINMGIKVVRMNIDGTKDIFVIPRESVKGFIKGFLIERDYSKNFLVLSEDERGNNRLIFTCICNIPTSNIKYIHNQSAKADSYISMIKQNSIVGIFPENHLFENNAYKSYLNFELITFLKEFVPRNINKRYIQNNPVKRDISFVAHNFEYIKTI